METLDIEAPSFEVVLLQQMLNQSQERETIAFDRCIEAVNRANHLTAELVRYRFKYYRAAGYPFPMEKSC